MPATPIYALPYPGLSDTADVPRDIQALADRLDGLLQPKVVTALPGSPVDGQEVYYQADATNGIYWHLRYRAASASVYKWEFVGGAPLFSVIETTQSATVVGSYHDLATAGPQVTLPLAGDYDLGFGASVTVAAVNSSAVMGIGYGASWTTTLAPSAQVNFTGAVAANSQVSRLIRLTGAAAAALLKARYFAQSSTPGFGARYLSVTPVRLG